MAVTKAATQILWGGIATLSMNAGNSNSSDAFTFDAASFNAMIQMKADNNGTPAGGDKMEFYLVYTTGDPDANPDVSDEYDTTIQGTLLAVLDTTINDPTLVTVSVNPSAKGGRLWAVSKAATNAITVSAQLYESKA